MTAARVDVSNNVKLPLDGQIEAKIAASSLQRSKKTGKPVIHFAHANGMPSEVYQPIFEVLSPYFTVEYIPVLGFDEHGVERYRVDNHWKSLTQHVIDSVQASYDVHQVPIIGLGHSLGALCTLKAMYKSENLFAQGVLMDPPMIYGRYNFIWHLAKLFSNTMVEKISPAGVSKHRRDIWDNRMQAESMLKDKTFFKNFDDRAFKRYIQYGLKDTINGKVTLTVPKKNEVDVFRTNPSLFWLTPNRPPKKPATLIVGESSQFYERQFPQKIEKRLSIPFVLHAGGHMFPLEHPDSVGQLIIKTIIDQSV